MTTTSVTELYRRWLDDLWNGFPEAAEDLVGEDFVGHWPDEDVHGPAGLAAKVQSTHAMFAAPGMTFTLQVGPLVDGDLAAARWIGRGELADGPITFYGNDILRVRGGCFVEYWTGTSTAGGS